ncbi:MAG TPA: hypothetical protein VFN25_15025 [Dokdonella sp.]|uniref:hypothetical protein n=1 Tax=Dokdonella sp. TaxID=2291710 RepID=UPI002D8000CD|nr:hypothetical protein [Dokdonella sp.]HET9034204.1 hypothetical protein [Dokdonella sp.]
MSNYRSILLVIVLLATACSRPPDENAPLAFVPSDTPFVMANSEPMPEANVEMWARQMQGVWPSMVGLYDDMLSKIPDTSEPEAARFKQVTQAILDEIRQRDTPAKWAEVGFSAKSLGALYGVGMIPVLRVELGDPDKFRAMVARVEAKAGAKLGTSHVDDQPVWTLRTGKAEGLMAIEDQHLVIAFLPDNADNALRRRVLGLDRPKKSLAETGGLDNLNKAEGYLPFGSGWIDFTRLVALIDTDPGYSAIAQMAADTPKNLDATCRSEYTALAARAPRIVLGYTRLEGRHMTFSGRLDLDTKLAQAFVKLSSPPPGSAAPSSALYDISLSLPVLKIKDFLIERSNAIVDAPFQCPALASLNEVATKAKLRLRQFVPPPLSDFTGLRLMVNRLDIPENGNPDVSAAVLIGSSNPMGMIGMAQLVAPTLRDFKLALDGKPVDLPAGIFPNQAGYAPAMQVAASESAVVIGIGADIDLAAFISADTATDGQLMRAVYSGKFYDMLDSMLTRFSAMMPENQRATIEQQKTLNALYARWIDRIEVRVNATAKGIEMIQTTEMKP